MTEVYAVNIGFMKCSERQEINANNLSSGIYFYSLKTDNLSETKKAILIK